MLPEIEDHIWVSQVGGWVSLLGMEEIWEFDWVVDEENWSIVSDHIVIAFFGVEFDGKTSWVSDGIWGSPRVSEVLLRSLMGCDPASSSSLKLS